MMNKIRCRNALYENTYILILNMKNTKCIFLPVIHFALTYLEKRRIDIRCIEKKYLKNLVCSQDFFTGIFCFTNSM